MFLTKNQEPRRERRGYTRRVKEGASSRICRIITLAFCARVDADYFLCYNSPSLAATVFLAMVMFLTSTAFSILVFVVDIMIGFSLYCTSWYLRYNIALLWFFISNMLLSISHHSHQFKYMTIPLLEASYSWF